VLVRQRSLRVSTKFRVTGLRASVFFDVILNDFLNLSRRRAAVTLRKPLDLTLERLGQGDEKNGLDFRTSHPHFGETRAMKMPSASMLGTK